MQHYSRKKTFALFPVTHCEFEADFFKGRMFLQLAPRRMCHELIERPAKISVLTRQNC
jgi:hypothetical protein